MGGAFGCTSFCPPHNRHSSNRTGRDILLYCPGSTSTLWYYVAQVCNMGQTTARRDHSHRRGTRALEGRGGGPVPCFSRQGLFLSSTPSCWLVLRMQWPRCSFRCAGVWPAMCLDISAASCTAADRLQHIAHHDDGCGVSRAQLRTRGRPPRSSATFVPRPRRTRSCTTIRSTAYRHRSFHHRAWSSGCWRNWTLLSPHYYTFVCRVAISAAIA